MYNCVFVLNLAFKSYDHLVYAKLWMSLRSSLSIRKVLQEQTLGIDLYAIYVSN